MKIIFSNTTKLLAFALLALQLFACAGPSHVYQVSSYNVDALRFASASSCRVGDFVNADTKDVDQSISFRGLTTFISPVGETYADYIARALKDELSLAGVYSENSPIEISGTLIKHKFDASGTSEGEGDISVEFVVTNSGRHVYKKAHSVHKQFFTGFNGLEASINMQKAHTETVEELLNRLYKDPDFVSAIRVGSGY